MKPSEKVFETVLLIIRIYGSSQKPRSRKEEDRRRKLRLEDPQYLAGAGATIL